LGRQPSPAIDRFNPVGFDATAANVGSDITDSNLVFMVTAKSGSRIRSIT
jgi:hypothetical protein